MSRNDGSGGIEPMPTVYPGPRSNCWTARAQIIGKSESACRQLIHRSRIHLRDSRARFAVTPECGERVFKKFLAAIATGDRRAVQALLAEEIDYARRG